MNNFDYAAIFNNLDDSNMTWKKIKNYDVDYSVWKEDKSIYISFQGTRSCIDILVDIYCLPIKSKIFKSNNGSDWLVHRGFYNAYNAARNTIIDECDKLYEDGDNFILIGRSLGGAMVTICAEDISYYFNQKVTLITFGAPKVCCDKSGTSAIMNCLTTDSVMFKNSSDLIPELPPFYAEIPISQHIGDKFNIFKAIKGLKGLTYHFGYGDSSLYRN